MSSPGRIHDVLNCLEHHHISGVGDRHSSMLLLSVMLSVSLIIQGPQLRPNQNV